MRMDMCVSQQPWKMRCTRVCGREHVCVHACATATTMGGDMMCVCPCVFLSYDVIVDVDTHFQIQNRSPMLLV